MPVKKRGDLRVVLGPEQRAGHVDQRPARPDQGHRLVEDPGLHGQHGLQIVRIFQDVITGTRATRQELDTLLNVAHQYDAVLVSAVDRLARRTAIAYAVLEELLETGAEVHSADMGLIDPKDEMSSMNFGVRSVFAQSEHMRIAKRLRGGMLAKVREAGRPVIPPSGYGWHKGEIQEEEAQWIRQIYTWAREGQSAHAITTELNRLGAPRRGVAGRARAWPS